LLGPDLGRSRGDEPGVDVWRKGDVSEPAHVYLDLLAA
jgi:hypothetical protein